MEQIITEKDVPMGTWHPGKGDLKPSHGVWVLAVYGQGPVGEEAPMYCLLRYDTDERWYDQRGYRSYPPDYWMLVPPFP